MSKEQHNIEDMFRERFDGFEVAPTPTLWKRLTARLLWQRFFSFSFRTLNVHYVGAAALLVVLFQLINPVTNATDRTPTASALLTNSAERTNTVRAKANTTNVIDSACFSNKERSKENDMQTQHTIAIKNNDLILRIDASEGSAMEIPQTTTETQARSRASVFSEVASESAPQPSTKKTKAEMLVANINAELGDANKLFAESTEPAPQPSTKKTKAEMLVANINAELGDIGKVSVQSSEITTRPSTKSMGAENSFTRTIIAEREASKSAAGFTNSDEKLMLDFMNAKEATLPNVLSMPKAKLAAALPKEWPTSNLGFYVQVSAAPVLSEYMLSEITDGQPRQYLDGGGLNDGLCLGQTLLLSAGAERNGLSIETGIGYMEYCLNMKAYQGSSYFMADSTTYFVAANSEEVDTVSWNFVYENALGGDYLEAPLGSGFQGKDDLYSDYQDVVVVDSIPVLGSAENRNDSVKFTGYKVGRRDKYSEYVYRYSYLQIPVFVGIKRQYGRFYAKAKLGLIAEFLLVTKEPDAINTNPTVAPSNIPLLDGSPFLKLNFSAYASVQAACRISSRVDLFAEPFFQANTRSIYDPSYPVTVKIQTYGVKCGLTYKF